MGLIYSDQSGYYTFNAHGDVTGLTDSIGALTQSYHYDAFGVERDLREDDPNPYRYAGEYFDRETGDIYLRARFYNPDIGRFSAQDAVSRVMRAMPSGQEIPDPLSLNLYTYCYNSPILHTDPSGNVVIVDDVAILYSGATAIAVSAAWLASPAGQKALAEATKVVYKGVTYVGDQIVSLGKTIEAELKKVGDKLSGLLQKRRSGRIDWGRIGDNAKHHVLGGTEDGHKDGWKRFGIDPGDPNNWGKILPFLKETVDNGRETVTRVSDGFKYEYWLSFPDKGVQIWVRLFLTNEGVWKFSDAAANILGKR